MWSIAVRMLLGGRAKYAALVSGVTATAFLVTFAGCFFCGMMTRSYALVAETPTAGVWVMDPAVVCDDQSIAIPTGALTRVRSVAGVRSATPLVVAQADVRFPNGRFQSVEVIGVDDASLLGAPGMEDGSVALLRGPDAACVAEGGTEGKLLTAADAKDLWARRARLDGPLRTLREGDELQVNDYRVRVAGRAAALPRFPPRPLVYMTVSNALRVLPIERCRTTFILVEAQAGLDARELARRIEERTGLKARSADDFKAETVRWFMANSEDVGDVETLLSVAMLVGLGVTGVMLFLFTQDNLRYYAMLKAMGTSTRQLVAMVLAQAGACGLLGTGLGIGLCALVGDAVAGELPFRMMWFTPVVGGLAVVIVTLVAATVSLWPVLKLEPASVFKA
jgi:putative ABC transport system permease protein